LLVEEKITAYCQKNTDEVNLQLFLFCIAIMRQEVKKMKFRLVIDKTGEEEVTARVHEPSELTRQMEELVAAYNGSDEITAYTEDDMKVLKLSEIECITGIDGKTYAVTANKEQFRLKQRLYEMEEKLPQTFIRINKSSLANQKRIERFTGMYSGAVDVIFKSGYKEYVSRRCFADIKRRMNVK